MVILLASQPGCESPLCSGSPHCICYPPGSHLVAMLVIRKLLQSHHPCVQITLILLNNWRRKWQPTPVFLPGESHYLIMVPKCNNNDASNSDIILLLLLLLSRFSHVRLCATPETAAHQAPPSLGFSRQEHWSGLPFLSPMHESEK